MVEKLFTRKELATYFNVSIYTIDNWIKSNQLKCFKINNTVRVSNTQVNEYLNTCETTPKTNKN